MAMDTKLGAILGAFIMVVVGAALLTSTANSTTSATQLYSVVNESATLTNNTVTQLAHTQLSAVSRVGNASLTLDPNSDYDVNLAQGQITLSTPNATVKNRAYDVSYTYHEVGDASARTIINLVIIFFALAVFLFVLALLMPSFRDMIGL